MFSGTLHWSLSSCDMACQVFNLRRSNLGLWVFQVCFSGRDQGQGEGERERDREGQRESKLVD